MNVFDDARVRELSELCEDLSCALERAVEDPTFDGRDFSHLIDLVIDAGDELTEFLRRLNVLARRARGDGANLEPFLPPVQVW